MVISFNFFLEIVDINLFLNMTFMEEIIVILVVKLLYWAILYIVKVLPSFSLNFDYLKKSSFETDVETFMLKRILRNIKNEKYVFNIRSVTPPNSL